MCTGWCMAKQLVSDELWAIVAPLLPPTRPAGTRGHPPVPNRGGGGRARPPAGAQPRGADRDHLCPEDGPPLGVLPAGVGLLWHDAVEPAARLAAGRRVGTPAPYAAATPGRCRPARLAPRQRGCLADSR